MGGIPLDALAGGRARATPAKGGRRVNDARGERRGGHRERRAVRVRASSAASSALRALLARAKENASGGEVAVRSVAEARALIERARSERRRREATAPTSARLAALESEADALRSEVRRLKDENREAIDALLSEAAELAEQTARVEEVEGELEEATQLNRRLVSAAQELAELVDESATEALENELAMKDAEIVSLKASVRELEHKLEDRDALLETIRSLEIELAESVTSAELKELADGKMDSPELISALEAENKEMRERINALLAEGDKLPAVAKKYEAAALEVVSLKSRIRLLEVRMADMVDQEELSEMLEQERRKSTELVAQKDSLLKRIRELEVAMSDMEEGDAYLKAKKEAEAAKLRSMDLSTLVDSLTSKLAEQTDEASRAKTATDDALANVRALESDMAYMDYAPGIESAMKAAKQMERAAERAVELAAGLQQLEVGMKKKSSGRKVPFKREDSFTLRKLNFSNAKLQEPAIAFKRSPSDTFALRKFDFTKIKTEAEASSASKTPFKRSPADAFKLRKMTFPFSSRTASVPKSVFQRTGNFELRRFIFTSDPVDVVASAAFERNGEFTLRRLKFPPPQRTGAAISTWDRGDKGTVFKF
ncbi:hypothetical protein BE221DRAFT_193039 [Ostreococcus tauri]|uniref:Uncharacterized protein n=1 Tax=Ostreococcus tauri TaxID=70448 RepID=A0A1Y5I725_OSTTA|nr:hypothetical protein BE221DRAFT_193039 [Ostreococcus tauri]